MLKRQIEREPAYVKKAFFAALDHLIIRDFTLLAVDASERAMCHRLAVYLEPWFSTFNVDCEYNRLEYDIKESPDDVSWFSPDIVVHDRLVKEGNLLVVDAKCTTNPQGATESDDLLTMIDNNDFEYALGVFLTFHTKRTELRDPNGLRVSGQSVTAEMLQADLDAGAPTNADGTINLVHYAAWLVKEIGRGD